MRKDGVQVLFAQHLDKIELAGEPNIGHGELGRTIRELDIEPIQLGDYFAKGIEEGVDPYLDRIHPNEPGQQIIAEVLVDIIMSAGILGKLDQHRGLPHHNPENLDSDIQPR